MDTRVTRKVLRQTVGASAAVVLAAVVNAAVASPVVAQNISIAAPQQSTLAGDLSWAVSGTASAQSTRSLLAAKAAQAIQSLDRLNGICETPYSFIDSDVRVVTACIESAASVRPCARHTESSHQYSAP